MEQLQRNDTNSLLKWIPIIPGILIFIGIIKLIAIYWVYNINILEYMSLSDALIVSIDDVIVMFILTLIMYIAYFKSLRPQLKELEKEMEILGQQGKTVAEQKEIIKKRMLYGIGMTKLKIFSAFVAFWSLAPAGYYYIEYYKSGERLPLNIAIIYIIFLLVSISTFYIARQLAGSFENLSEQLLVKWYIPIFLVVSLGIAYINVVEAFRMKLGLAQSTLRRIEMRKGPDYELDKSLIYIGKLDKFTFLYWRENQETIIIKNDDIESYSYIKEGKSEITLE